MWSVALGTAHHAHARVRLVCISNPSYELYMKPEKGASASADLISLDARLSSLESQLGINNAEQIASTFPDLSTGIAFIKQRLLYLRESNNSDPLMRRVTNILAELEELEKLKTSLEGEGNGGQIVRPKEYEAKVHKLYEEMPAWDEAALKLPLILARLLSVKQLSERAADAKPMLTQITADQDKMEKKISSNRKNLQKLTAELKGSLKDMESTITTLESTFDKLK